VGVTGSIGDYRALSPGKTKCVNFYRNALADSKALRQQATFHKSGDYHRKQSPE
jgi:hypothetical protein